MSSSSSRRATPRPDRRARPASARLSSTRRRRTTAARRPRRCRCRCPAPRWRISPIEDHESSSQDILGGTLTDTITVVNNGPGTATGVDLTDALSAAAQVIAIEPGAFTCSSGAVIQCSLSELGPGASESIEVRVQPLRPGQLIDAVTVSDDQFDPSYANESAKTDRNRETAPDRGEGADHAPPTGRRARPCRRLRGHDRRHQAHTGSDAVGVRDAPTALRVIRAPGAIAARGRLCWDADALVNGTPLTFHFSARILPSPGGATLAVRARLTGANFTASRTAATVAVPPRRVVACPSRSGPGPPAAIAC